VSYWLAVTRLSCPSDQHPHTSFCPLIIIRALRGGSTVKPICHTDVQNPACQQLWWIHYVVSCWRVVVDPRHWYIGWRQCQFGEHGAGNFRSRARSVAAIGASCSATDVRILTGAETLLLVTTSGQVLWALCLCLTGCKAARAWKYVVLLPRSGRRRGLKSCSISAIHMWYLDRRAAIPLVLHATVAQLKNCPFWVKTTFELKTLKTTNSNNKIQLKSLLSKGFPKCYIGLLVVSTFSSANFSKTSRFTYTCVAFSERYGGWVSKRWQGVILHIAVHSSNKMQNIVGRYRSVFLSIVS
jgi:hypothetical protein